MPNPNQAIVTIGGQDMTMEQYDAARYPLLHATDQRVEQYDPWDVSQDEAASTSTESGVKGDAGQEFTGVSPSLESFMLPPEDTLTIRLETAAGETVETIVRSRDQVTPGQFIDHGKMLDTAHKAMDAVLHRNLQPPF
jgi:hypothetical protein